MVNDLWHKNAVIDCPSSESFARDVSDYYNVTAQRRNRSSLRRSDS